MTGTRFGQTDNKVICFLSIAPQSQGATSADVFGKGGMCEEKSRCSTDMWAAAIFTIGLLKKAIVNIVWDMRFNHHRFLQQ